jgi:antitoxin component YwqK of YwqJK toxin-antitoxin module
MKIFILLILISASVAASAQRSETYYDFYWKPCSAENARYFGILEKTDSGWFRQDYYVNPVRLQMQALYKDKDCEIRNGYCYYFHANGVASIVGRYINGKQEGVCISYYSNGMMSDSALFHNGQVVDKRIRWHRNGYMSDSIARVNDSTEVNVGWFDDGQFAYAGYLIYGKENGKWKYYHHNGQVAASEVYRRGEKISAEYFKEDGKQQTDTSNVNRAASFKGGIDAWKKYLEKNLYWPSNLAFTTSATVTIGIDFAIDENGKTMDAEVALPFHDEFDRIALKTIKNCPAWMPAISHNRKVKAWRRQPVSFSQPDN